MKNKLLFVFIFSIFIGFSQQQSANDSLAKTTYKQRYGLRVGLDISKPIRSFLDKDYKGIEITADYRYNYKNYFATEIGLEQKKNIADYFQFSTKGQYIKLGIDHNTYNNWYGMENMIYVGGRYGFSTFQHKIDSYIIHTHHNYWKESVVGNNSEVLTNYTGRTAHWLEFIVGLKVELVKNLYAGATIRLNKIVFQPKNNFPNYFVPGFGRVWENSSYGINYNYSFTYLIPFYKKQKNKSIENQKTKK